MSEDTTTPVKILCVDDEPSILNSLRRVLRRDGYQIVLAEGGQAALDRLDEHEFALVICDQRMPEVDGPTVLTACYQQQPHAYRITLTGFTDIEAAARSINNGHIDLFLTKPWDDQALRQAVAEGVRHGQLAAENQRLQTLTAAQNEQLAELNRTLETRVEQRTAEVRKRSEQALALLKQIEITLDDAVGMMGGMLEMLAPAAASHGKRVGMLAERMAYWNGMDVRTQREAATAGRLHEIGGISAAGCRLRDEADAVRRLPPIREIGYGMLSRVSGFKRVAEAVRDQEEWYNGSQSPNGKRGQAIPILARILAVVKTYDEAVYALGDIERPDVHAGREAVLEGRASRLDPKLVDLLLDHVRASASVQRELELSVFEASAGMVVLKDIQDVDGRLLLKAGNVLDRDTVLRLRRMAKGGQVESMIMITQRQTGGAPSDAA